MNPYQMFKLNGAAESNGIDLDYGAYSIRILRAGSGNKKYTKELQRRIKPHRYQIDNGLFDNDVAKKMTNELYADTIIIGWSGVTDEAGNPLPFNRDNVVKLLTDLPELANDIQAQAVLVSNFRAEEREADAKNLNSSSATN